MFCRKCGNKLEENWKVCPNCGERVDSGRRDAEKRQESPAPRPKKKNGMAVLAVLAVICLAAGAFSVVQIGGFGRKELPDNDLENLLSSSPDEIPEYGFLTGDEEEEMFKTEDESVYILFSDSKLDIINVAGSDDYCFHGIQTGMERTEIETGLKDAYTLQFENEYQMGFLNEDGSVMVLAESEEENGKITRMNITCNEEYIEQTMEAEMEYGAAAAGEPDGAEPEMQGSDTENIVSITDEDRVWFVTYDQFQADGKSLFVEPLTDALMNVYYSGSDGTSATWEFGLEPAEIADDGAMVYYYGKGISMRYYPADHHITIVSYDDVYAGDYQYTFDFEGGWWDSVSQRCYMEITCQNDQYYYVTIDWADSASENSHWEFTAEYDPELDCLVYQDGRYTQQYFPDDGSGMQETEVYVNGEGLIYQKDGKVYWDDQTENAGSICIFER